MKLKSCLTILLALTVFSCQSAPKEPELNSITGMFRYMADAAAFRDCRNGLSFPVAMEGAYIDVERAYMAAPHEAGAEVIVYLRGRYLERPSMEGDRNQVKLIVDHFDHIGEGVCEPPALASLTNTWWKLTMVAGKRVVLADDQPEPHMVLESTGQQVRGNGGCNRFFGEFKVGGDSITFSAIGSTRMACPTGEDIEQTFLPALSLADRYTISGEVLELYSGKQLLARFESVYH